MLCIQSPNGNISPCLNYQSVQTGFTAETWQRRADAVAIAVVVVAEQQ